VQKFAELSEYVTKPTTTTTVAQNATPDFLLDAGMLAANQQEAQISPAMYTDNPGMCCVTLSA
jgi:hypothetical protein